MSSGASTHSGPAVAHDAIILAGGRGERLGGADKAQLKIGGRRLIEIVLHAASAARAVVVVGSRAPLPGQLPGLLLNRGRVRQTVEEPPLGGPAAGVAAGLAALDPLQDKDSGGRSGGRSGVHREAAAAPWVLVLACDLPGAALAVPSLLHAAVNNAGPVDGVLAVDEGGRDQPLLALYRREALDRAVRLLDRLDGASMRALLSPLTVVRIPLTIEATRDIDVWEDVAMTTTTSAATKASSTTAVPAGPVGTVTVRFFAAAAEAAGRDDEAVPEGSLGQVLAGLVERHGEGLAEILPRCSLLADGALVDDPETTISAGATLDVLPPFAGG